MEPRYPISGYLGVSRSDDDSFIQKPFIPCLDSGLWIGSSVYMSLDYGYVGREQTNLVDIANVQGLDD